MLTDFSGITPTILEGIDTRIEDVQAHLLSIIQEHDIIVGHSLENDLKALRLVHLNVVDTSVVFRGVNGRKYGESRGSSYVNATDYSFITFPVLLRILLLQVFVICLMYC